jgi:hypothetical protein
MRLMDMPFGDLGQKIPEDANGRIRHHHFGEGEYEESEHVIQQLLAEAGHGNVPANVVAVQAAGAEAAADASDVKSPETYIGFDRAENFGSPGGAARNEPHGDAVGNPRLNEWGIPVSGRSAARVRRLTRRTAALSIAFMLATCMSCLARLRRADQFASA